MDEFAKQDKVPDAKDHREYIEQVDERKGRAITRGDLLISQLGWQGSVKAEIELVEVSRRHSIGKKKPRRPEHNDEDMIGKYKGCDKCRKS